jgi:VanZ family protein
VTRPSQYVAPSSVRFGLVAIVALVLLYASVTDPSGAPLSRTGPLGVFGQDKWLHAAGYGAFALSIAYALLPRSPGLRRGLVATVLIAGGYGVAMELLQYPLGYRAFDSLDATANVLGALAVALALAVGSRLLDRLREPSRSPPERGDRS